MESPRVPAALASLRKAGLKFDLMTTSFFLGRWSIKPRPIRACPCGRTGFFYPAVAASGERTDSFAFPPITWSSLARKSRSNLGLSASRPRGKAPGNKVVEGENSWPARNDDEKAGGPDAVGRPGIGIDENFDDRGHAEKDQRGQAAGEAYDEQYRKEMLAEGSDVRGERGIDQRQLIFVAKQRNRIVRHVQPFDLGLPRHPEHGGRKNPCRE